MPVAKPTTSVGTVRSILLLSPNWPLVFRPQHFAPPPNTAHVCTKPATAVDAPCGSATTSTGVRCMTVVPSPNWPLPLRPQHSSPPLLPRAQEWPPPAVISDTPLARP